MGDDQKFPAYLRSQLDRHRWSPADLSRASGLSASLISRWLHGETTPGVENARAVARAITRPLLEVLVAAGQLTPDEAGQKANHVDLSSLTDDDLLAEVRRRLHSADPAPTRADVVSDPGDFVEGPPRQQLRKTRRKG
ncbi:helix-turn-helix domain-containing protein [Prauserella endophytica]|uniref:Helix-turn-helix transcriptional regulator n=1 Tax=Prauserella endophytica TaxID=1592324 RepID=A0ABY2S0J4_9PSEU|nr:helix-turn-helix transcriptional regulator [Prauserella endophytica]PXY20356.1 hypothetical protein BAY59_31455 [Prauserella coralliicola]TKG66959.1 helix-turn-helix transcriptional regulator [Prauserella endophytica]